MELCCMQHDNTSPVLFSCVLIKMYCWQQHSECR